MNAHQITREFEKALCEYTGAPYAVAVNSCTMALLLACAWQKKVMGPRVVSIPKRTYVGVPMSIHHAGHAVVFRDETWAGQYFLDPLNVIDAARRFTYQMYRTVGSFQCVSFHWSKILGLSQGGAILHDNSEADAWLRRARFDGRHEGLQPVFDNFDILGWHCYMSPEVAAHGIMKLGLLPDHNADLPNSDYSDLSLAPIFGGGRARAADLSDPQMGEMV